MLAGYLQFAPRLHDKPANLERIRTALAGCRADLVLLPELCTTGYLYRDRPALAADAEPVPDGPTCAAFARLARDTGIAIVWGMAELDGDRLFNSAVLARPDGSFGLYRKAHLFWNEKDLFEPGDLPFPVFDLGGTAIGLLVCFDHFFPEAARSLALKGAQVICHCANLVLDIAQTTTIARAAENRVWWILANRTGAESLGRASLRFTGESQLVAPDGKLVHRAPAAADELHIAEIDPARASDKHATPRNDLLADRRTDLYTG